MFSFVRTLFWRLQEFCARDCFGFNVYHGKGDDHHVSSAWVQDKKRDAMW